MAIGTSLGGKAIGTQKTRSARTDAALSRMWPDFILLAFQNRASVLYKSSREDWPL